MKKLIMILVLFCWCINIYGQESITDTTEILSDVTDLTGGTDIDWKFDPFETTFIYTDVTDMPWAYLYPSIVELIELYEEYETQCFNDSTELCFNYYFRIYHLIGDSLSYKIPCTKNDMDLEIDVSYTGTGEEWVHVQPSFIGFMQYLKKKR